MNIVVVDAYRLTRSILRMMLQERHYKVIGEAIDGDAGGETCVRLKPDIAFIDIEMPKLNGHHATRQIRLDSPQIRVIMISALATVGNMQLAMQAGASGFVAKPLDPLKVSDAIDHFLKHKG